MTWSTHEHAAIGQSQRSRRAVVTFLLAALVVGGCGDDEEPAATDTRAQTAPLTETTTTASPRTTSTATGEHTPSTTQSGSDCGQLGRLRLRVVNGTPSCDVVRRVSGEYDVDGAKVQTVRGWTCASGTEQTRPIVFTCSLEDVELVAEEPAG